MTHDTASGLGRGTTQRILRSGMLALVALGMLPLSGCGSVGTIISKSEQFEVLDSVQLRSRPRDFVALVEAAAVPVKLEVAGLDRANNKVTLADNSSMATGVLIGKIKMFRMDVTLGADGRTAAIKVYASGNFGSADREKVEKRVADFKSAMLAQ